MEKVFYFLLIILGGCGSSTHHKDYYSYFEENKSDYVQLVYFLLENKNEIIDAKCDKIFKSVKQQNDEGCFPLLKDSFNYFIEKKIFQAFDFYPDSVVVILVNSEITPIKDREISHYFIYSPLGELPRIYTNQTIKRRLDNYWWYVEEEEAYY